MELEPISEEKVYSTLRSVFRYMQMKEQDVPEIMIESESDILERRFQSLNADEIYAIIFMWPEYAAEQATQDAIQNKRFDEYMMTVN